MMEPFAFPELFPASVCVRAISFGPELATSPFSLPREIEASVPKRRAAFVAGRVCAEHALCALGAPPGSEVATGAMRAPVWPSGFVGSITHAAGVAAAAVSPSRLARSLGVDVEQVVSSDSAASMAALVARPEELRLTAAEVPSLAVAFTTVFSAKESLFKCLAPVVGLYFDFLDVEVTRATSERLFLVLRKTLTDGFPSGRTIDVRFALGGERVFTGTLLPAEPT